VLKVITHRLDAIMRATLLTLASAFILGALIASAAPVESDVLSGKPSVKYETTLQESERRTLGAKEIEQNALRIVKIGPEYICRSRENRALIYTYPGYGAFHYFVDPQSGLVIKVCRPPDGKITYVEQLSLGLVTLTYFGVARDFRP
jgi:hypothetical protein